MHSPAEKIKKVRVIADVEVLRAIAVLVTILMHQSILTYHRISLIDPYFDFNYGVDIFFVISGFVIARSLIPTLPSPGNIPQYWRCILAFWIRRIWRLWPSAWLWLGLVVACSFIGHSGVWGDPLSTLQDAAAIVLQIQNLHRIDPHAIQGPQALDPYWSLSLEEQFYLLLPVLLFFTPRRWFIHVLMLIVLSQFFLRRWALEGPPSDILWSIRTDGLLFGVLIALTLNIPWVREQFEPIFLGHSRTWRALSVLLPLFLMSALAAGHIIWFGTGLIALLSAWLVWIASYDKNYLIVAGPLKTTLIWIGERSYAIYLIHEPAFYFSQSLWAHAHAFDNVPEGVRISLYIVTASLLIAVLSDLNYRFVETPLRKKGAAIARRLSEEPYRQQAAQQSPAPIRE